MALSPVDCRELCDLERHLGDRHPLFVPGIKDAGGWTTAGHADRVVEVDSAALASFATLYDAAGTPPRRARLPALHAKTLLGVLEKLAAHPRRLEDLGDGFHVTGHWHETMACGKAPSPER